MMEPQSFFKMHWLIHRAIGLKYIFKQIDSHKVVQLDWSYRIEKWSQVFIVFKQTDQPSMVVSPGKTTAIWLDRSFPENCDP